MTLQKIFSCLPAFSSNPYSYNEVTSKKEDDYGLAKVNEWKKQFPADKSCYEQGYVFVGEFCKKVVRGIKPIPYTHTTSEAIGDHLAALAIRSRAVYSQICNQLNMENCTFLNDEQRGELSKRLLLHVVPIAD
jgi:hypothetical protein